MSKERAVGQLYFKKNLKMEGGEARDYYYVGVRCDDGRFIDLLLTAHELEVARNRAEKNPEDTYL